MNKLQRQAKISAARLEALPQVEQFLRDQINSFYEYISVNPHWKSVMLVSANRIEISAKDSSNNLIQMVLPNNEEGIKALAKEIVFKEIKYLKDINEQFKVPSKNSVSILEAFDQQVKEDLIKRQERQELMNDKLQEVWALEAKVKQLKKEIAELDY